MLTWEDIFAFRDVAECVLSFMSPPDAICTFRRLSKACKSMYIGSLRVSLSQPIPHHAFTYHWGAPDATRGLSLKQRRQLLILTARSGVLENLEIARVSGGCTLFQEVFDAAAAAGHLHICGWLCIRLCPVGVLTLAAAAAAGHLAIVRWLLQRYSGLKPHVQEAWTAAAGAGHQAVCEGLLADGYPCVLDEPLFAAARGGHADLMEWLLGHLNAKNTADRDQRLLSAALYGCNLDTVQEYLLHRIPAEVLVKPDAFPAYTSAAATSPTADWQSKLQWLEELCGRSWQLGDLALSDPFYQLPDCPARLEALQQRGPLTQLRSFGGEVIAAARTGNVAALRLLLNSLDADAAESELEISSRATAVSEAAAAGHVQVLEMLVSLGWQMHLDAVKSAALHGRLDVLQWMVGSGSAPGLAQGAGALQQVLVCGLQSGSLELVRWLREARGCPWDEQAFKAAAQAGNRALLEWLSEQGCPVPDAGVAYQAPARNGDLATLRCLHRMGCPWGAPSALVNLAQE